MSRISLAKATMPGSMSDSRTGNYVLWRRAALSFLAMGTASDCVMGLFSGFDLIAPHLILP